MKACPDLRGPSVIKGILARSATANQENKMSKDFVHLHMHTEYSLLDGINRLSALPQYIKSIDQKAVAITDHGNISGAYRFYKECKKNNIKPIIGMEAYYTTRDRSVREVDELDSPYYHLILIALNNTGLHNLIKLSSYAYSQGMYRKPRLDDDLLGQYSEGICATTACLGSRVSQLILNDRTVEAEKLIDHHRALFSDRFLVELQLHEMEDQQIVNKVLLEIAQKKNLPIILTNDCHYQEEHDKLLHEIALCMQTKAKLSDEKRFSFGDIDVHVASHDWMWNRATDLGLPYDCISNTVALSDMVDSNSYFMDRKNRFPKYKELPEELRSWQQLEIAAKQGLFNRFGSMPSQVYRDRLDEELLAIKMMGFSDYMLIVSQFMNGARDLNILHGPGRGSAAGSLVAYALNITEVDPIKYGLLFARFLNIGRSAKPLIFNQKMVEEIEAMPSHSKKCNHTGHSCGHSSE